jgi:hypothetical protein
MSDTKYHIISLKHTKSNDTYLTLWRPDSKGYCWPISMAGEYTLSQVLDMLPDGDDSYAVPVGHLGHIVKDHDGRPCYKNSSEIRKRIKQEQP